MAMNAFDFIGRLEDANGMDYVFRVFGAPVGEKFELQLTLTNFGEAWNAELALDSLADAVTEYVVEVGDMHNWLREQLDKGKLELKAEQGEPFLATNIVRGDVDIDVRIPPEGALKILDDSAKSSACADLAIALLKEREALSQKCEGQARELQGLRGLVEQLESRQAASPRPSRKQNGGNSGSLATQSLMSQIGAGASQSSQLPQSPTQTPDFASPLKHPRVRASQADFSSPEQQHSIAQEEDSALPMQKESKAHEDSLDVRSPSNNKSVGRGRIVEGRGRRRGHGRAIGRIGKLG